MSDRLKRIFDLADKINKVQSLNKTLSKEEIQRIRKLVGSIKVESHSSFKPVSRLTMLTWEATI